MKLKTMLKHIDHSALKPTTTWQDVMTLCEEKIKYEMASVCVPPCYVKAITERYTEEINVCTVIGFPLGYQTTDLKLKELEQAQKAGAREYDLVINLTDLKNEKFEKIATELKEAKKISGKNILKVIIETCYLTEFEKIKMCELVTNSQADYIKTSTGFGSSGAMLEDIGLFKKHIGAAVKIKAAGGIKTEVALRAFLEAGCERIGCSSAVAMIKASEEKTV